MEAIRVGSARRVPWNKGKLTGQKPPLKLREIWAIRIRLQLAGKTRDLALFNLAIDSKLRACDLTRLRVSDICLGSRVAARATIMQQTTQRPVQFEITEQTRTSVEAWRRGGVEAWRRGCKPPRFRVATICFRVASTTHCTCRPDNTLDRSIAGYERSDWMMQLTERIRCAGPRLR